MYVELLSALHCPRCSTNLLTLQPGASYAPDGELIEGMLECGNDGSRYPITDGIPDLLGWSLPPTPAQVVNYLPPTAWAYERLWRHQALTLLTGERFGYNRELPLITALLAPDRPGLYVDVACSNGLYARAIALRRQGHPGLVVGIDHALPMLHEARRFARRAGLRISYVRARAQALPFGDGAAVGVAMGGSFNEIGDTAVSLREMRRVLAADGRCVMMSLVRASTFAGRVLQSCLGTGGVVFPTLAEYNRLLQQADLRLVAQWQYRVVVFSQLMAKCGA